MVDYLVKPISKRRFLTAIDKLCGGAAVLAAPVYADEEDSKFFFVKSGTSYINVEYADILYAEGLENYVRYHCTGKPVVAISTMKNMENTLLQPKFLRIHRSYIVNISRIDVRTNSSLFNNDPKLPISASYKKALDDRLKAFHK